MECVEGALKSSFTRPEMVLKPTQHAFLDDLWTVNNNGQTGGSADDFFVDDLLDFSKAEEEQSEEKAFLLEDKPLDYDEDTTVFLSPQQQRQADNVKDFSGSVHGSELCVPADDLADLEWLSNFVDDSSSGYSLTLPAGKLSVKPSSGNYSDRGVAASEKPIFASPVQTKARSKRARTGFRVWSLGSHSLTDSSASSSSSSSYTSSSSPLSTWVMYNDLGQSAESMFGKLPAKKQMRKPASNMSGGGGGAQPRRCSHCHVQKTPQWRTGPLGAKTLCNACGVRYKSGRLLPEYRPACSPTFSSEIHSNNHREVLEMRRKKEGDDAYAPPVESF